ncbi:MAG: hypothetical protein KC431_07115, partial [Myxococcales bacterium]|nr:hypothetical protein [Myxococcales bacterium]
PRRPTTCTFTVLGRSGSKLWTRGSAPAACTRLRDRVDVYGVNDGALLLRIPGVSFELRPGRPRTSKVPPACWRLSKGAKPDYFALEVTLDAPSCER